MNTAKNIAERFGDLDFHDDTFICMNVLPSQTRNDVSGSVIEIQLLKYLDKKKRLIRFIGCANLRVALDFDVLVNNLPPNTSGVEAHIDGNRIRELMRSQKHDWGLRYSGKIRTPLENKLEQMDELVCFRLQFFGGVVEVIAREFLIGG
jgi:hypothetical protein